MRSVTWATDKQKQVMRLLSLGEGRLFEIHGAAYLDTEGQIKPLLEMTLRGMINRGLVERSGSEYPRVYYSLTEAGRQCLERSDKRRRRKSRNTTGEEEEITP